MLPVNNRMGCMMSTPPDTTTTITPLARVLRDVLIGYGAEVLQVTQVSRNDAEVITLYVTPEGLRQPHERCQNVAKKLIRMGYVVGISWSAYPEECYRMEVKR